MGSTLFRDPQARSSALAALGTLQPRASGSLNHVDPLDSVSNYYVVSSIDSYMNKTTKLIIKTDMTAELACMIISFANSFPYSLLYV